MVTLAGHLEQGELPLHRRPVHGQVMNLMHRNHPEQLRLDLHDHLGRAPRHDRDAAAMPLMIDLSDSKAFDIIAPTREKPDHPRQHAAFVIDHDRQRMLFDHLGMGVAKIIGRMARRAGLYIERRHDCALSSV